MDDAEREDFVMRCTALEEIFNQMAKKEQSPRVWASTLIRSLKYMIKISDDPDGCRQQVLDAICRED